MEDAGFKGRLVLIDGGPELITSIYERNTQTFKDNMDIQIYILSIITEIYKSTISEEVYVSLNIYIQIVYFLLIIDSVSFFSIEKYIIVYMINWANGTW